MIKEIKLPTFLVVSDNPAIYFHLKKYLDDRFFIIHATGRNQALSSLHTKLDFILVDSALEDALPLCKELNLRTQKWFVPIWLITGRLKKSFRDQARSFGVSGFLSEQLYLEELEHLLATANQQESSRNKISNLGLSIKAPVVRNASLKNKLVLNDQAFRILAKAKKENVPIALLLLRIDHFDAVAEKDKISSLLVSYIDALLRENDILQPSSEGYFILLLFNTKPESAKIIAVRLQEKIRKQQFKVGNQKERLTISIAVSALAANETSFNKMIRSAEKSLKAHTDNSLIISIDE